MVFSIDSVVEILGVLSKPTRFDPRIMAFQRDGQLYLVDREAVAIIDCGLPCSYNRNYDETFNRHLDNSSISDKSLLDKNGKIIDESEKEYFKALSFGPDSRGIKFKDFFNIWEVLNNDFKDDGKIRMINHDEGYHSHKHGYAVDGIDVWVNNARVMVRQEYFDSIRMNELRARDKIGKETDGLSPLPGVAILTPYAFLSFPFFGKIKFDDSYVTELKMDSSLEGDVVEFNKKVWKEESPYSFNISLNPSHSKSTSPEVFSNNYESLLERLNNLKNCYTPKVHALIDEANRLHNQAYEKEIKEHKRFRKKSNKK